MRLLQDDAACRTLATFAAVLVGGAALPEAVAAAAAERKINIVHTYGMSETAGGCVYDGVALEGAQWKLASDGRILLAGPMLAQGYLGDPDLTAQTFQTAGGTRWFHTADHGRQVEIGRAHV